MENDANDVSYEEYMAMIEIFEEMDIENKEKFIETSYINYYYRPSTDGLSGGSESWEISPVFQVMAIINQYQIMNTDITYDQLSDEDDPIHNKLFSGALMMNIATMGKIIYNDKSDLTYPLNDKIDVEITEKQGTDNFKKLPYDYTVIFPDVSADPSGDDWYDIRGDEQFGFDLYQYRGDLDSLLDEKVVKDNVNRLIPGIGETALETAASIFETAVGFVPVVGTIESVASSVMGIGSSMAEYVGDNKISNYIYDALDAGNAARALYMKGVVTVSSSENATGYTMNYVIYNRDRLEIALDVYKEKTGKSISVDDIINGKAAQTDVNDYVTFANSNEGQSEIQDALEERR
jgi:hypothetical protein